MLAEDKIKPIDSPIPMPPADFSAELIEVNQLTGSGRARGTFRVDGDGLAVAILDTGLNMDHVDFASRVPAQVNFTSDNGGDKDKADDGEGHGTNVAGIIAAGGDSTGMAPKAQVIPLKVLDNSGGGDFAAVKEALQWVIDNRDTHEITAVCMSLGGSQNFTTDSGIGADEIRAAIQTLRKAKVAVVIAAGNDYFVHSSAEGMSYPAIIRECVSVGAVYDAKEGSFSYAAGAIAHSTDKDRITPFSQRLHPDTSAFCFTDLFAPGAPVTASGIGGPHARSVQHGTSQAAPTVTGIILLAQQFYLRLHGALPEVDDLVDLLRATAVTIHDGDDEHDNVRHTNKDYKRIDAFAALSFIKRQHELGVLAAAGS